MKSKKEPKKKPYRSALSNALWSFRGMLKHVPMSFVLMVLEVPMNVLLAWAGVYLPSLVVAEVTNGEPLEHAAIRVGTLLLLMFITGASQLFCETVSLAYLNKYRYQRTLELDRKSMDCFFQNYEKKELRDLYNRALITTQMWDGEQPISDMPSRSLKLIQNVVCYCLFGTVISFVNPWLVPILTLVPVVNWLSARAYRQWEYSHREKWTGIDRKLWYVQNKPAEFAASKDIRVFGMAGWFRQVYADLSEARSKWDQKLRWRSFLSRIADLVVILLRDGAAYVMLIMMILNGEITVDQFVLYFAAISTFATYVGNIMNEWNGMHTASLKICDFREYMDFPDYDGTGSANVEDILSTSPEIVFDHVTFRYDGAACDTLRDISFTIKAGEKIAVVGLNGAGKTTLVKLLCGLYLPTAGDIRINGVSVREMKRKDFYRLFSPVFQDLQTSFFSLAEMVSGQIGACADLERVQQCMRLAGLGDKIDALPQGIHTTLDKQVNKDSIDLSGGELQKLMLARALYKNAPILVLDEPTAALDPIAENQIYMHYHSMTASKTSLFISHRLASTQFCDRILYLQDGKIIEEGTHQELITLGGEYYKLYELQSCWYQPDYEKGVQK